MFHPTNKNEKGQFTKGNKLCVGRTPWNKGKERTPEEKRKISLALKGRPSWNKGLKVPLSQNPSNKGKHWRKRVWERDNWKCRINNSDCKGRIETHHILGWSSYPELRYNINNGITLCHAHHPRKRAKEKQLAPIFKELIAIK